jgi:SAM-dependent methyltransferase
MVLGRWLAHPSTRGLDLDAPETTALRREIVRSKSFLHAVYDEWYRLIVDQLPPGEGTVLELGSGGGFLEEYIEGLVTSDVFPVPGVQVVIDGRGIPFADNALKAIVMTNVLHHIPDVSLFFSEAQRCLRLGGRVVMVEPWNTGWSRFVHKRLHVEPMISDHEDWSLPESGPLSGANAALPWIVTMRDRSRLDRDWPKLRVVHVVPFMPFRYLVSGGVSMRSLQPGWSFRAWSALERWLRVEQRMAVFALIVLERS